MAKIWIMKPDQKGILNNYFSSNNIDSIFPNGSKSKLILHPEKDDMYSIYYDKNINNISLPNNPNATWLAKVLNLPSEGIFVVNRLVFDSKGVVPADMDMTVKEFLNFVKLIQQQKNQMYL